MRRADFTTLKSHPKQKTSGVVLVYDNTCPHSVAVTQQFLGQFKWDAFDYPTYNAILAPSDFYRFPELKDWLGSQTFHTNKELQNKFLSHHQQQHSLTRGLKNLFADMTKAWQLCGKVSILYITIGNKFVLLFTLVLSLFSGS